MLTDDISGNVGCAPQHRMARKSRHGIGMLDISGLAFEAPTVGDFGDTLNTLFGAGERLYGDVQAARGRGNPFPPPSTTPSDGPVLSGGMYPGPNTASAGFHLSGPILAVAIIGVALLLKHH